MRILRYVIPVGLALGFGVACSEPLAVDNTNNPDRARVFRRPADVEALAGSLYQQIHSATFGSVVRTQTGMMTASFMNASALANNGLGPRSALPRGPIDNSRSNPYIPDNFNDFSIHQGTARTAAQILDRMEDSDFAVGLTSAAHVKRLESWTRFMYGVALGNAALVYDSAAVPLPEDAIQDNPANWAPLQGYEDVMEYALDQLDQAEAIALDPAAASAFPIPASWLKAAANVSLTDYLRIVRSYRARLRADVARTPAERDAVDWTQVIADATAGIQADFTVQLEPAAGWDYPWLATGTHFRDVNWHQMPPYVLGMADTAGSYDDWLATPRDSRNAILIRTPDKRFPAGDTRPTQNDVGGNTITGTTTQKAMPAGVYFRNRAPGLDQITPDWRNGQYDHYRWRALANAVRVGTFVVMPRAEIDMLAAEGYLRLGGAANVALAAALIDRYRVPNGLASLVTAAVDDPADIVPGGNACVPQVPQPPTFASAGCGTVFNAMQWEKLMETAYAKYGAWFFDMRGWGWLPEGTAYHWPVPFQELDARRHPLYNLGGLGGQDAAGVSVFQWGTGDK
jgi:hypothetical protein